MATDDSSHWTGCRIVASDADGLSDQVIGIVIANGGVCRKLRNDATGNRDELNFDRAAGGKLGGAFSRT